MSFADIGLEPDLLNAIKAAGYETPTPIQKDAIPPALEGRDVLGIAQTGTGKTASFTLPMIQRLSKGRARARMPRSLVLAPTRELADQVSQNFEKYGVNHKLSMALLIGGVSFGDQDAKLTRGVDVLIATPGRLLDHFERGRLLLTGIELLVVDEADRMLDMGFIPDIERIFKLTPMTRQTLFFSATMPPEIQRITDQFLHNPARIEVAKPATTAETITQRIVRIPPKNDHTKRAVLRELLGHEDVRNGIIFCNRKSTVDTVAKSLQKHGFNARPIHGDLAQAFRMETLEKFRNDEVRFLVASDVAARGLDIPAVSHVFNFDVPIHSDDYVHRIGRTGRAGRQGAAMMLVAPTDGKHYDSILKTIGAEEIQALDFSEFIDGLSKERRPRPARDGKDNKNNKRDSRRVSRKDASSEDNVNEAEKVNVDESAEENTAKDASKDTGPKDTGNENRRPRKKSSERKSDRHEDNAAPVVGLGDHVPDFLSRAAID